MKTGDGWIVDEWVNNTWPTSAIRSIEKYIPDYQHIVKFRTSTGHPVISGPIEDSFQLVINYNCEKERFIVWNAAIQSEIHHGEKIHLSIGEKGKEILHEKAKPTSVIKFYRNLGTGRQNQVELILFVGKDAMDDFCKEYKEMIKPDCKQILAGKTCLYAVAGEKIEYIQGENDI